MPACINRSRDCICFSNDKAGNLTAGRLGSFLYDAENRLMRVTTNATGPQGALVVNYAYGANGRRTQKSVVKNGVTTATDYLSDGDHEVAEYSANASTPSKRFIYGQSVDEVIAQQDVATNTYSYAHRNHQGSVVAVSNASGQVAAGNIYTYSAYGEPNTLAGFPYRYTGRRLDAETGLYYYRARYYDSALGRFLQTDPIGYKDQMNLYAYVGNDPVNMVDPSGKVIVPVIRIAIRFSQEIVKKKTKDVARSQAKKESKDQTKSKTGPKTNGEGPHNEKIKEIGDEAVGNGDDVVAGGGQEREKLVPTPGGKKGGRRPDVIIKDRKTGELRGVNVGRTKSDGSPVKREQEALDDLNNHGDIPTTFVPYD